MAMHNYCHIACGCFCVVGLELSNCNTNFRLMKPKNIYYVFHCGERMLDSDLQTRTGWEGLE